MFGKLTIKNVLIVSSCTVVLTGKPSLMSRANVTLTVVDRAMPVFDQALYSVAVPESLPQYATVVTVSANSPTSASLVYSVVDGNAPGIFGVDFSVGEFRLRANQYLIHCGA